MKVVGLIVEYNPLHNGHLYHYQEAIKATQADACVAVMSGNFLQRGEPAIVSKWARTKMALAIGVDLVIELPTAYCTQNAEVFAFGAVSALHSLGVVDSICFGSESGSTDWLEELAQKLANEPASFKQELKQGLSEGLPYPSAYANAAANLANVSIDDLNKPNNILGLNYILALKRLNSSIKPYTITRVKAGYNETAITDQTIASATALRKLIAESNLDTIQNFTPLSTYQILREEQQAARFPIDWDLFFSFVRQQLLAQGTEQLALIHEMDEGIEHRLKRLSLQTTDFQSFMEAIKTKRYTWNRLQRLLLYLLLNVTKREINNLQLQRGVPYIRALGFNQRGQALLRRAGEQSLVPVIGRIQKEKHPMLDLDVRASNLYQLAYQPASFRPEHTFTPIKWK
ncbi:hypothetical protein BEP19_07080 [Ammoniphilus oxalaticus]|uniref:tRNA(Met) cytidine acetate ligase n=1 Tax=Ammoniphilus oxalaticus TaxID=66863 RepID=A0A419SJH2_9BACL|nr:nucleotidyltransferase [Ammoniphilus oxalaticus]RKD24163.1 hypothetical protein BEP19_07080 [Ammoniphilus oxalaticus]